MHKYEKKYLKRQKKKRHNAADGEGLALEIWGMWGTTSLPLLPGPFWLGVVAPDKGLSMGQIEQTVYKQKTNVKLVVPVV